MKIVLPSLDSCFTLDLDEEHCVAEPWNCCKDHLLAEMLNQVLKCGMLRVCVPVSVTSIAVYDSHTL